MRPATAESRAPVTSWRPSRGSRPKGSISSSLWLKGCPTPRQGLSETADLLVDQLLTGWYGAVAVEMMALGKPVVCYLREDDLKFIDSRMRADPRAHT